MHPCKYKDDAFLKSFVSRKLIAHPEEKELRKFSERIAKSTMKKLSADGDFELVLKEKSILPMGDQIPNFQYLNACMGLKSPHENDIVFFTDSPFMSFFVNEYSCLKQSKVSDIVALEKSLGESVKLFQFAS